MEKNVKYNFELNKKIGSELSKARKEKGLSYRTAGALVGMTGQALHYYESGRSVVPLSVFIALADTYGQDPVVLLKDIMSQ